MVAAFKSRFGKGRFGTGRFRGGTTVVTPPPGPTGPAMFAPGQWSIADDTTGGAATVSVSGLPFDGGAPVTGLFVRIDGGAAVDLGGTGPGSYPVTGFGDGVPASVVLFAVNAVGAGPASAPKTVTTTAPPGQMAAPGVTGTDADTIRVDLAVAPADNGAAITGFDLRHSTDQSSWVSLSGISNPQSVAGLAASTTYFVQTRAVNANGAGAWSAAGSGTTQAAGDTIPPTATGFTVGPQDAVTGDLPVAFVGVSEDAPNSALILTASQQTALTAAQVLAGSDETGAPAPAAIGFSVLSGSPSTSQPLPTGLSGPYYVYATLGDSAGNASAPLEAGPVVIDTTLPGATDPAIAQTGPAAFNSLNTADMLESAAIPVGSGVNRMLVALVPLYADSNSQAIVPTATFGAAGRAEGTGVAMTEIVLGVPQTRRVRFHVFALPAPGTGSGTVQISPGGQRRGLGVKVYELTDVDQDPANAVAAYVRTVPGTAADVAVTTGQPNAVTLNGLIIQSGDYTSELAVSGGQIQDEAVASGTSGFSDFTAAWGTKTLAAAGGDQAGWTWTTSKDAVGIRVAFEGI